MPGIRRPRLAIEAERRAREQRARIGAEIQTLRERRRLTRTELAKRAGLGRMVEGQIERGVANPDLEALQRIAVALGRPLVVSFAGRDAEDLPAGAGHLAMQELVLRIGRGAGYTGFFELATRPAEPWRSADIGLAAPTAQRLVHVECWNTIGDIGAAVRSSNRKRAELADLAIRPVGKRSNDPLDLGRSRNGAQPRLDRPVSGGLRTGLPGIVAAVTRCTDPRNDSAERSRTRLVRRVGHAVVRVEAHGDVA